MFVAELDDVVALAEGEDGVVRLRTVDRVVQQRGGWATVLLLVERRADEAAPWGERSVHLVRLQRRGEGWKVHARASLGPATELRALATTLVGWTAA